MAPFTAAGANKYLISPFLSTIIAASRTLLQQLITCLNFPLDSEDLFYCYKQQVICMNYGSTRYAQAAKNHGDE